MSGPILGGFPHARVDPNHPEAFAVCDRCGFVYNIGNLKKQQEWRGNQLMWTGFLVCDPCLDVPFELNRPVVLPPDPPPVPNARPPNWVAQSEGGPAIETAQQLIGDD
jgi:hypothetical protein